ncbi:hypothetical protein LTR36_006740 [Oleoguttula mirabilis]|uniref:Uncharacterized protein n=1 Tax=Oleoguttula mirabilis TaxID=1507867 RepID=A0AAV9JCI5_9PEZI|nr:hypothetical protein LTR36_006740 [Oleoguttula mirabilis]
MLFHHLGMGALIVGSVYGSPLAIQVADRVAISGVTSVSQSIQPTTAAPMPTGLLLERQGFSWRNFKKGTLTVFAAAYAVGDTLWVALVEQCQEFANNTAASTGVQCVYRCIETIIKFAWWYRTFNNGNFETILNSLAGETKRDASNHTGWHGHWHGLSADQQSDVRSQLPQTPGFWMHSIGDGSPDITGSAAFHFAADGANDASFRHVTNGSHGFLHTLTPTSNGTNSTEQSKRAVLTDSNDYFSFGEDVTGVKLSYIHPCDQNYGDFAEGDLDEVVNDLVQSFLQGGADKYAIEVDGGSDPVLYGSLIVEGSGFGENYEGIDFTPENSCHDEL